MNWVNVKLERNREWANRHMEMANRLFAEGKPDEALEAIDRADSFLQDNVKVMAVANFNKGIGH